MSAAATAGAASAVVTIIDDDAVKANKVKAAIRSHRASQLAARCLPFQRIDDGVSPLQSHILSKQSV